jgi:3-oxoacyl-[acyl-carrier-protein] synthase-3
MITGKPIKILSMGTYFPRQVLSSEIEKKNDIPRGWAEKYSGVKQRFHVTTETNGFMGARAAESALKKANIKLNEIDMLISAGGTFDYPLPNQASIIKNELTGGREFNFPTIDIDNTCLSFVAALDFVSHLLSEDGMNTVLIVSSETSSKGLNKKNWETVTLFGDAAAAAVVTYAPNTKSLYIKGEQKNYIEGVFDTIIEGGGNAKFFSDYKYDQELHSFKMNGKNLLRLAKKKVPLFMQSFFEKLPLTIHDVPIIIPHQASKMGLSMFKSMFKFKEGQVKETIKTHGNCIAASIPLTLALCIEKGDVKRGDLCLLCGTSAGFSIGAQLIKF